MTPDISVIVPVFNEQAHNLTALVAEIERVMFDLAVSFELVFVDDGSLNETNAKLRELVGKHDFIKLVILSRNFGEQAAICAGLKYCSGKVSVNMDSDLQDPPSLIKEMLAAIEQGYQVVLAKQVKRHESPLKVMTSMIFYRLVNLMADRPVPVDVGEFRMLTRPVIDAVNQMPERVRFLRELVPWMGFRQLELPFTRADRAVGESGYTLGKLIKLALQAVLVSSTKPLFLILPLALLICLAAFAGLVISFTSPQLMTFTPVQLAFINFSLSGVTLLVLGVVAPYLARVIGEVRSRPLFIVSELVGFAGPTELIERMVSQKLNEQKLSAFATDQIERR